MCIHTYIYAYVLIYIYTHVYKDIQLHAHICIYALIYPYLSTHVYGKPRCAVDLSLEPRRMHWLQLLATLGCSHPQLLEWRTGTG